MSNLHNQSIPKEVLDQATAKLNEVANLLKPYVITLTTDQRHSMLKRGDKSSAFVSKAFEYARQNPEFVPAFVDVAEFAIDVADSDNLIGIVSQAAQLLNNLDDTTMVAGSEAYYAALAYYNNVKLAVGQNVPGAKAICEELQKRFPGKSRSAVAISPDTAK